MRELLEAGVHFGHKTRRWNPKMAPFIYGEKDGVHIINLQKTVPMLHTALGKIHEVVSKNGRVIFVGTKPQAQEIVAEAAKRCGQHYINKRWLGGMLTNWKTISNSIRTLRQHDETLAEGGLGLKKKEKLEISREAEKLERAIGGIKDIGGLPDLIIVIDTNKEDLAIKEAKKLGIPVIAIVDSNCDPEIIDYPIPGNDDSIRAINLYCKLFSDAALAGISEALGPIAAQQVKSEAVVVELPKKEEEPESEEKEGKKKDAKPKVETVVKKSRKKKEAASEEAPKAEEPADAAEETTSEEAVAKPAKKTASKAKKSTKE